MSKKIVLRCGPLAVIGTKLESKGGYLYTIISWEQYLNASEDHKVDDWMREKCFSTLDENNMDYDFDYYGELEEGGYYNILK